MRPGCLRSCVRAGASDACPGLACMVAVAVVVVVVVVVAVVVVIVIVVVVGIISRERRPC